MEYPQSMEAKTQLLLASQSGDIAIIAQLLSSGAKINERDSLNRTPLIFASMHGRLLAVDLLLSRGANCDDVDENKKSSLYYAVQNGFAPVVALLLAKGANVQVSSEYKDSKSLIIIALSRKYEAIAEYLLPFLKDPNEKDSRGNSLLMLASLAGFLSVVTKLLMMGADINYGREQAMTPLVLACGEGHVATV